MTSDDMILEELKGIRKLLTPPKPDPPPEGLVAEFTVFLKKYKVIGLAVAFILAIYLGALIQSFVYDIIMPLVNLAVLSAESWEQIYIPLGSESTQGIMIGLFAGNLLTFIIMAFIMFLLVKFTTRIGLE